MFRTAIYSKITIILIIIVATWYGMKVGKWKSYKIINHDAVSFVTIWLPIIVSAIEIDLIYDVFQSHILFLNS